MRNILISCVVLSLAAQEKPVVRTTTDEVILDVVVRDKKGKPIRDLTSNDVVILDNGQKQEITSFRFIEGREAIEHGLKVNLDPLRQLRLVTLVFERLSPEARRIAKDAAIDLVKGEQAQNVFYSVFAIDSKLHGLQSFTADKALLQKAIDKATAGQYSIYTTEADRLRDSLSKSDQTIGQLAAGNANPSGGGMGAQAVEQRLAQIMMDMMRFDQATAQTQTGRISIFSLLNLVRGQSSMPGRKTVIYFSQGMYVPPQLDEPFRSVLSAANRNNVTFYAVDTRGVLTLSQNASAAAQLQYAARRTAAEIVRTDGTVDKEDILAADTAELAGRNNVQLALRELSESTGGFMIGDSNDLRVPLRRVNNEVNAYYEIAYNPGIRNYDGTFRKTVVETTRKDLVLHARNGYFALPPDIGGAAMLPYEIPLLKALDSKPLLRDLEFRSAAVRFEPAQATTTEVLLLEVPLAGIQFTEDAAARTYKARVSVMAIVKDAKGEVLRKFSRDLPLAGPLTQIPQVKAGNFIYREQLALQPGRYTLETAALDHESGKLGARKSVLFVPERKSGVALSSLSLVRNYQPTPGLDEGELFQFQGGRITPALASTVYNVKGAQLSVFFVVYPDPTIADKPELQMEYLLDGKTVGRGAVALPSPDSTGKIPYVMSSPAEGMAPGNYEVRAVVKQGDSVTEERAFVMIAARP